MIKKFKNGNINLKLTESDGFTFIDNEMFWNDMYIQSLDDNLYIVDYNKQLVYDLMNYSINNFIEYLEEKTLIKLIPYCKKESLELIKEIEEYNN